MILIGRREAAGQLVQGLAKVAAWILLRSRDDLVLWVTLLYVLLCLLCEELVILGAGLCGVKQLVLAVGGVSRENSLDIGSSATCLILLTQR